MDKISKSSFTSCISEARFNKYRTEVNKMSDKNNSDVEILAYYYANTYLCSQFYPVLNMLEVALRNSIDSFMIKKYKEGWLCDEKNFTTEACKNILSNCKSISSCVRREKKVEAPFSTLPDIGNTDTFLCLEHNIVPQSTINILNALKKRKTSEHNIVVSELSFGF